MAEEITKVNIRDINPLEHITSDIASSRHNYEAILNGLVTWNTTDNQNVTVRLVTDNYPYFVDYTFPSRKAYAASGDVAGAANTSEGNFDFDNRISAVAAKGDIVTLRLTADGNASGTWMLFENAMVFSESGTTASREYSSGNFIRSSDGKMLIATADISKDDTIDIYNTTPAFVKWNINDAPGYADIAGLVALYEPRLGGGYHAYAFIGGDPTKKPITTSSWKDIATDFKDKAFYSVIEKGQFYLCTRKPSQADRWRDTWDEISPALYMYVGDTKTHVPNDGINPVKADGTTADDWYGPMMIVPVMGIDGSRVIKHETTTDIDGYILRAASSEVGTIKAMASVAVNGGVTEPSKGLGVFRTCNYSQWPTNTAPVWYGNEVYDYQSAYTAKMVFRPSAAETKKCNIINYDGPDMDCGLAIYLPASDTAEGSLGENAYLEVQDGTTFEFMFRIWPNTSLNGASTPDLIINKAQIYVYSVNSPDELDTASVVAKFSMARLTNFYLWAENVAVPNRPVFYKAKFIYSAEAHTWRTYDYYQIPDHVFLSPKGFVDPSAGVSEDEYAGIQTAGFPLMQDPFSGLDMGPIMMNRIEQ